VSEAANIFVGAIILRKTSWPIVSEEMYAKVDNTRKLAIQDHDPQWELAGAPVDTPSVCDYPGCPSLHIDQELRTAYCLEFWEIFIYQTYDVDNTPTPTQ